jgi:hypothetical protein
MTAPEFAKQEEPVTEPWLPGMEQKEESQPSAVMADPYSVQRTLVELDGGVYYG